MTTFFTKIAQTLRRLQVATWVDAPTKLEPGVMPPFYEINAALAARAKTWRGVFFAVAGLLTLVIVLQQRIIFHKLFQKMGEQIVIVPGSPEFFRVRPGQVPDESVFLFAEYVAANVGTFSYRNVKYHFGKISEYMTPIARGRFEAKFEQIQKDWALRKVDETFAYEPVRHFDLVSDEHGPKYIAAVEGTRVKYVEGRAFSETHDVLLLHFRSRGNLTADHPFIFEIEDLEWMTPEQFQALKAVGLSAGGEKGKTL